MAGQGDAVLGGDPLPCLECSLEVAIYYEDAHGINWQHGWTFEACRVSRDWGDCWEVVR
jgi:hypothetical protein